MKNSAYTPSLSLRNITSSSCDKNRFVITNVDTLYNGQLTSRHPCYRFACQFISQAKGAPLLILYCAVYNVCMDACVQHKRVNSVPDKFKGRVPTRSFGGSIDVGIPHRKKLAIPMWGNFVVFIGIYLVYLWNK